MIVHFVGYLTVASIYITMMKSVKIINDDNDDDEKFSHYDNIKENRFVSCTGI